MKIRQVKYYSAATPVQIKNLREETGMSLHSCRQHLRNEEEVIEVFVGGDWIKVPKLEIER